MTRDDGKGWLGRNELDFLDQVDAHRASASAALRYLITQGQRCPLGYAIKSLAPFDRIIAELCDERPDLPLATEREPADLGDGHSFAVTVSTLGRVHIRPLEGPPPEHDERTQLVPIGYLHLAHSLYREAHQRHQLHRRHEAACFARVRAAIAELERDGELDAVLRQVMGHTDHVESVCFYLGDRLLRVVEGTDNLVTSREGAGYLSALAGRPLAEWPDEAVLLVGALHSLFLSGRAVRFEEFNGLTLTAGALVERLRELYDLYCAAGLAPEVGFGEPLFRVAREIRRLSAASVDQPWLRYRWIFGLSFFKTERILDPLDSDEDDETPRRELEELHAALLGRPPAHELSELGLVRELALAALRHGDTVPLPAPAGAATSWLELLIQAFVASAVRATRADYGMSSSLRDIGRLVATPPAAGLDAVLALTHKDFYTCFVGNDLGGRYGAATAEVVASSCQKRMMFNRWHFIPGNFPAETIPATRHWYYPPLVPDIAIHADVRRQGHARAGVRFSIRVPGPDMSLPPLRINGGEYRGFFDIRVVRMAGQTFEAEDMVRARRRNLWMGALFEALVGHLAERAGVGHVTRGFEPGAFLDLHPEPARPRWRRRREPRVLLGGYTATPP